MMDLATGSPHDACCTRWGHPHKRIVPGLASARLYRVPFRPVTLLAEQFKVARGVGATSAHWDDVVELQSLARSALNAHAAVTAPDLGPYSFRDRTPNLFRSPIGRRCARRDFCPPAARLNRSLDGHRIVLINVLCNNLRRDMKGAFDQGL